jgi:SagB-type dehydrogenase family enzyme
VYLVADNVEGLAAGVYKYHPAKHELEMIRAGGKLTALSQAALDQQFIREAPVSIVIAAVYDRTKRKYGERAYRYAQIEVGAAVENIYLQAETLSLGTVVIGAFHDDKVRRVLDMADGEIPLAIMPVGKVR